MNKSVYLALILCFPVFAGTQSVLQLYGPMPVNPMVFHDFQNWKFPGNALTASTQTFHFDKGLSVRSSRLIVALRPANDCRLNLVIFDDGPSNIESLHAQSIPNSTGPVVYSADITESIQRHAKGGLSKHIGYMLYGHCEIYSVRIELVFN